ncbi:thermonuclease family protein [Sphingopyxis sp.]|uniref:thermonuclease family protein n=1 Tax=Sphingopyxis sp. TaxID=1908224 RepID=UPI003D6C75A0
MSDLPPGFELDAPTAGLKPKRPPLVAPPVVPPLARPPVLPGLTATGGVVDGDTIRLTNGTSGRLLGFDAFEKGQPGYRADGTRINLGDVSAGALSAYIRPSQTVAPIGKQTYGRPVITLGDGAEDPMLGLLWQGAGYAAPDYLRDDPQRAASYTEAERLGRMNRQGGFGTTHIRPDAYRRPLTTRTAKLGADEFLAFDDQLPDDAPKLKRLDAAQEKRIAAYIASQAGNPNFSLKQYRDWFRNDLGVTDIEPSDNPKFIEDVRKGEGFSPAVDYGTLDGESVRELQELIAFSGLRPEDAQGYRDLLGSGSEAQVLDYARSKGMTLDPRDLSEYFAARDKGERSAIPLPIINPGDGRTGAAARGFGDPLGFLDEMGAVPDALGMTANRESIFNSDRSFGDIYENNLRQNRAIIDYDETNHPWYRFGGQMVSGAALPGSIGVRGVAGYAKAGGAIGGVYGFGSADGTLGQRLANVPLNAAGGALLGGTLGKGFDLAAPLIGKGFGKMRGLGRGAPVSAPVGFAGEPGSLVSHVAADDLPPGFALDDAPISARPRDTLDIQPGPAGPLPVPALGERVPSAPALGADHARAPNWIDIAQQPAPSGGTLLEQVMATGRRLSAQRADMAGDTLPSLSSPRLRDVIDVGANRTTRLLDGPTEAMMRTAAARVDPGDVLPRPANEVQSLDEFNRISQDLYPDVRAPNERDALTSRQFPSRSDPSKSFNRRGPLDLAAYVREQGGVADFRGELKAAGLSNVARKGDDFVGGENRLGPLLNDEGGASLDDMAQRAWEAGYFPDHHQRPTVDEFVTALGDTYRGVNRTFRPDDYAELDAYGAARDQRFAVERAKQEGAPLADDMGQPATYDDIIANTPPATAYDDWNNAVVSKVGNIRVDKLESPQDIGQALKVAENVAGGFDAAKRGKISFAETQALAQDLGMTADDLLARRKGQAFSAEEAYAARAILAKSGNELVNLARRVHSLGDDPGSEALAAFRKALVRHTAIQEQVSGMTAEAGRALSAFRMNADSRDAPGRVLEGIINAGGGKGRLQDVASAIIDLERDPANLNRFIEKVSKPTWKDKAVELWYNYLLSGPQTHAVNMLSNTMTSMAQIPEFAVAAGVGAARRALRRDAADRVLFGEVGARAVGLLQGTKEGARMFATALRTGEASDFVTKVENQGQKAISGVKGELLRMPSRFLTAEDEMFKGIARRMELNGLAVRKASQEGFKGQEARDRAAELLVNPTDDMMLSALEYGRYATFQAPLGRFASKVSQATTEMPILKAVLPFVRTPTNLFKFFVERSPGAPVLKEFRRDFAAGGAKRDLAIAKVMVGSGMGATVAELAAKGVMTGSPPKDDNKRRLMEADGWQPYSVKIGDKYYSYKRLDPFALTIGAAADLATLSDGMTDKQLDNRAGLVTASILGNLSNKTWLSGISDLLSAADDPERFGSAFIKRLAGSIAVPTGVAQIARTMDPTARETPDIASTIQSRLPGLSDNLLPKRDVWGRPLVNEGGLGPDIVSPIWTSADKNDPITREALRVDATISKPQKGDLTAEQYDRLQDVAGSVGRKWLGQLIASPEYQALDTESQADEIGDVMKRARKAAKAAVLTGEPILDQRPMKGERKRRPAGLPGGFNLDPLPDGFVLDR